MNRLNLHIEQFKCFSQADIELRNLTVLTGANASGKSSIIQSLLLLLQAKCEGRRQIVGDKQTVTVSLQNDEYAFDFGDADEITNKNAKSDVVLGLDNSMLRYPISRNHLAGSLTFDYEEDAIDALPFKADNARYLTAERMGPRYEIPRGTDVEKGCGCHGQNTASVFEASELYRAKEGRWLRKVEGNFSIQRDQWIDYVFPKIRLAVQPVTDKKYRVIVHNGFINKKSIATNVGFGITYALPIILEGLLIDTGGWLIVENPEAHIHAKAQSNMGFFLGCIAAAGVRVVVETHSEHIVNGIRRAVLSPESELANDDVNIYYFNQANNQEQYQLINIDEEGNLTEFPVDFFDQQRQDLLQLMKLAHPHNNR